MGNHARGYIPPELWDNGITAGLINYNFTGNNAHNTTGGSSRYAYLNLQSGLNIGAWRLRDNSTWSYSSGGSTSSNENRWQHVNSWLERDITPLRSRLTLGDSYTNGDVFDGINFRGAQLASDDNMLPDSQKGFAPVIHGSPAARRRCQSGKTATKSTRAQCRRDHLPSTISTPRAMAAICRSRSKKRMAPASLQRALVNGAGSPA